MAPQSRPDAAPQDGAPPGPGPRRLVARLPTRPGHPAVWALVVVTCLPEFLLVAADAGILGTPEWRGIAYQFGAFWNGLLADWTPLFSGQTVTMFLSYAFLHGGMLHLLGNMVAALALGGIVVARAGWVGLYVCYFMSILGGAGVFALLSDDPAPMVGASGAVFGLIGAWKFWDWEVRRHWHLPMAPLWQSLAGLAIINVVLWFALGGFLAWETHLGGFVAGWVWAWAATRHHPAAW